MLKVNNKNTKTASFEQINASWVCHFLTICLKDTCMGGSKLTAVEWFYSLLTLLLTSNQHSLAQTHSNNLKTKSSGLCSDFIKIIWTTEVVMNIEASCLWCFALFEDISRFRFSGSCWSIISVSWAWIGTIGYWYYYFLMFV